MRSEQNENSDIVRSNAKEEVEIDLLNIFRRVIAIRKILCKAALVGAVVGIVVGISIPKKYTVKVTLSPEMNGTKTGGLSGLAASFLGGGVTGGDASDALNVSLASDIVSSTPFLMELLSMNVPSSGGDKIMALDAYLDTQSSPWWNYVVSFPSLVIGGVKSLFTDVQESFFKERQSGEIIELTREENSKINTLRNSVLAIVDKQTAITIVSVTLQNPRIAAVVADSVVRKLQKHITTYRTSKAKEDCAYLERMFEDRRQEYYVAQREYATYVDTHDNLILQSVRTEQERLQNDMSLAYQVYSQVATQLQVSRAKVQEEKPVFAVVEPAVVPLLPSGMGTKMYMLMFMFLTVFITMGWLLLGKELLHKLK